MRGRCKKKGNITAYPYLQRRASHVTNLSPPATQSNKAVIQELQPWNTPAIILNALAIGSEAAVIERPHYQTPMPLNQMQRPSN